MGTKIKIDIFGSCVSRDVLEYQSTKDLEVNNYIARQSLISAVSKPVRIDEEELNIESPFQKRMVLHDFRKDAFRILRENKGDYLMIDLIDERFPLACIDNSYVTYSNELSLSGYIQTPHIISCTRKQYTGLLKLIFRKEKWFIEQNNLDEFIKMFCDNIIDIYGESIIIHHVYLQNQFINNQNQLRYFDDNSIGYNNRVNGYYKYLYQKLKEWIPHAYNIALSDKYFADEKHKWGLAPMHFEIHYYEKVIEKMMSYIY